MTATKFVPKAAPTNLDLQDQNLELHGCIEQTNLKIDTTNKKAASTNGKLDRTIRKVDDLGTIVTSMAQALHVEVPSPAAMAMGVKPRIRGRMGSVKPWQFWSLAIPALVGAPGIYKIIEPVFIAAFLALHHALLKG